MKNYRPEIDGLRAFAILPVVLFHAGFKIFSGGFIGVDIFFVISGYLITGIISNEIKEKKFNLINFYERRARRILPNLLFVVIFSSVLSWLFLDIYSLNIFGKSVIGVVTFCSNFYFWLKGGYFSESTELMPLMHTWSLSVEEQFYLFFPILMILLSKLESKKIFNILIFLTFLSLCLSIFAVNYINPIHQSIISGAFYLLPTRAWELGIGALISIKASQNKYVFNFSIKRVFFLELLGISMVLLPIFLYSETTSFPGFASISPVLGTGILLLFCNNNTIIGRFLANKLFVFIGLISYSLYLWHHVIFSFWRNTHLNSSIDNLHKFLLIVLSFAFSYISYKFIEKPFRNGSFFSQKQILSYSFIFLAITGLIGFISTIPGKNMEELSARTLLKSNYIYFQNIDERKFTKYRIALENEKVDVIVMGSSRLMQLGSKSFGKSALNLSVSGASVEDLVAFLPESINKFKPSVVYIGADPWIFNKNSKQDRWTSVKDMYEFWKKKINEKNSDSTFIQNSPNIITNKNRITSIYNNFNLNNEEINGEVGSISKKSKDGSCIYDKSYSSQSQENIRRGFLNNLSYAMNDFKFDSNARDLYISLIKYLKTKNIEVIIVLSPYHPELFKLMKSNKSKIPEIENNFIEIAHYLNVKIVGSYDISKISKNIDNNDFYDGIHPKDSLMTLIVK